MFNAKLKNNLKSIKYKLKVLFPLRIPVISHG